MVWIFIAIIISGLIIANAIKGKDPNKIFGQLTTWDRIKLWGGLSLGLVVLGLFFLIMFGVLALVIYVVVKGHYPF